MTTISISIEDIPEGYFAHEATCPTCGHEYEVLFWDEYDCSTMLGFYETYTCPECGECFTMIRFENGVWVTYAHTDDEWMYAAGMHRAKRLELNGRISYW